VPLATENTMASTITSATEIEFEPDEVEEEDREQEEGITTSTTATATDGSATTTSLHITLSADIEVDEVEEDTNQGECIRKVYYGIIFILYKIFLSKLFFVQVVTTSRRFQSAAGYPVPIFLPDHQSEWFKHNERLEEIIESTVGVNNRSFRDSIEAFRNEEENHFSTVGSERPQATGALDLLGMLIYKIENRNEVVPNVMCGHPPKSIEVADFNHTVQAQIPYKYSTNILANKKRSEEDYKEIRDWLKTMPPRPTTSSKGFQPGVAADWFKSRHDASYELVLPRVLEKFRDPNLKRPSKAEYSDTQTLATDQAILDALPEQKYFTVIGNSNNAGYK
jgi:hypothetical protein